MKMPVLSTWIIELGGEWAGRPKWEYIKSDTRVWRRFVWGYMSIAKDITPPDYEGTSAIL